MTAKCPIKSEAKALGKKRYFNGRPCSNGHVADRVVSTGGCVVCTNERRVASYYRNNQKPMMREYARKRRAADPAAERQRSVRVLLKSKYGLTEGAYAEIYAKQNGKCAICTLPVVSRLDESRPIYSGHGAPSKELARVDHCHATGAIRGLLCSECNILLGKARDNEQVLLNAVRYLRESATATGTDRTQHETLQGTDRAALSGTSSRAQAVEGGEKNQNINLD